MVFYNVYNLITSYIWGGNSDLENQKLRNEPIRIVEISPETLQEKLKSLRKVETELACKIREDIELNNNRTDHIRTEEDIKNNKPLSELEMNKVKNAPIRAFDCVSSDLREHIKNLKSIGIYEEVIIERELTIFDEIRSIQNIGLDAWFNRKK